MKEKLENCLKSLAVMNANGVNFSNKTKEMLDRLHMYMTNEALHCSNDYEYTPK